MRKVGSTLSAGWDRTCDHGIVHIQPLDQAKLFPLLRLGRRCYQCGTVPCQFPPLGLSECFDENRWRLFDLELHWRELKATGTTSNPPLNRLIKALSRAGKAQREAASLAFQKSAPKAQPFKKGGNILEKKSAAQAVFSPKHRAEVEAAKRTAKKREAQIAAKKRADTVKAETARKKKELSNEATKQHELDKLGRSIDKRLNAALHKYCLTAGSLSLY